MVLGTAWDTLSTVLSSLSLFTDEKKAIEAKARKF